MRLPLAVALLLLPTLALAADPPPPRIFVGYQGWHAPAIEGTNIKWMHLGSGGKFEPGKACVDLWPDVSDLAPADRVPTAFTFPDGKPAEVYSSANPNVVDKHFEWMKTYGIDGAYLQRFAVSVNNKGVSLHVGRVLDGVRKAAEHHGRSYAIMYDLSGLRKGQIQSVVMPDWKRLATDLKVRDDKSYLRHTDGRPIVAVWGIGFNDNRDYSLAECADLVKFLQSDPTCGGNAVMIGVPFYWRTLNRDTIKDPALHDLIRQADIVSPWAVGRYAKPEQLAKVRTEQYEPDLKWLREGASSLREGASSPSPATAAKHPDYLPVIFPGFSWHNLQKLRGKDSPMDQTPRRGGQFLWAQAVAASRAGARDLYVAMFDEIDEGTAIYKTSPTPPDGFLKLDAPRPDHYLWVTQQIGRMLRGKIDATDTVPARK